ncbi:MAG TPA: AAA family ATPase, partial [Trebonia sp.]|nr:AAA family ATPase [Trebonia sp.]
MVVSTEVAAARAKAATEAILADLKTAPRGVVVDSPPGAGKSTLVVRAAAELADAGERVIVIAQTNEQVDDLAVRLAVAHPEMEIGRLSAQAYARPERLMPHENVRHETNPADLEERPVVIGTAAKWATVSDAGKWPWAIVDEAYQMRSDLLLRVAGLFEKALFVGDPGQLDPFSTVETQRWMGLSWDPMSSAVAVMLAHNPDVPVHALPVSWRLPACAAPVVSDAFYPFTAFTSATSATDRALRWATPALAKTAVDEALELAAAEGWALYELPHRHTLRTDREAVAACAELAVRTLQRGAVAVSERGTENVTAARIAIGTAHRDQAVAVRAVLASRGVSGVVVDTANRLQGREFELVIVLHPLSGRRDATAFHLET